jgi:hypothetical protein
MNENYYKLIRKKYVNKGEDHTKLFQTILSITNEIGLDRALKYLEKCVIDKRLGWLDENLKNLEKFNKPINDAFRIFYEIYLGVSIPKDGEIVEKTDNKLVTRWWNFCPTLEVCKRFGLDTREICMKVYHEPVQVFLSRIDSGLRFDRNYDCIRPRVRYCEEMITLGE